MSRLGDIVSIAQSGLQVAQSGLNTVSNNVANVNTPGYVRSIVNQSAVYTDGVGGGVKLDGISRATNVYLEAANLSAQSDASKASTTSSFLTQAQSLFGDPSSTDSFFSQLDSVYSALSTAAAAPSSVQSTAAVAQVSQLLTRADSVQSGLQTLGRQADTQIGNDVSNVNQLLAQISTLNTQISRTTITGGDVTAAQSQQGGLIGQLTALMNVNVSTGSNGVVTVRTGDGSLLASDRGSATLAYDSQGPTGQVLVTPVQGIQQPIGSSLSSGELSGLLNLRNSVLPSSSIQLAQLVSQTVDQLNQVSNQYASTPAPGALTGANTGLDLPTAVSGFTGRTSVGVVNPAGVVQTTISIDFGAGTMTVAGASSSFTPSTFLGALNTALGSSGSASFANGQLSIAAAGGAGVVLSDPSTGGSSKAGKSFSAFFGLNDLVQSSGSTHYQTGLTLAAPSGFPAGQTVGFRLSAADGSSLRDVQVTTPSGGTMASLVAALNDPSTGVGLYGGFVLDATGGLAFTPASGSGVTLSVGIDQTARGTGGPSLSQLFGIGDAQRISDMSRYAVRPDILSDSRRLPSSAVNLTGGPGSMALATGDVSGIDALAQAGQTQAQFKAAGTLPATVTSVTNYAAQLSGALGSQSAAAAQASTAALSVAAEAKSRLSSVEGVNIDQELISLTTYQQSYNASARLVQAAKDMFTTLLGMTGA